ncbi:MAG: SurA N-terminal domain-containing protein [Desulfocapsa sp.]|nr:SurA N-terminal domain-containing protein [Desulfocapsa sp.]
MKRKYSIASLLLVICLFSVPVVGIAQESVPLSPAAAAAEKQLIDLAEAERQKAIAEQQKAVVASKEVIVASVEGTEISMFDLVAMMNRVVSAFYGDVKVLTPELNKEIQERALDRLIFEELAVREAVRQKIIIAPEKIDKVIEETKKTYSTEEEYQKYLSDNDISEEQLRAKILRRKLLQAITGKEIYQKVNIDPKDMERLYSEYKEAGKLRTADEFFVKEILVLDAKDKDMEAATAQVLLYKLKKNDYDFGKLLLDGTFIVRDLRVKKDKLPVIFKSMKSMEVGEFSDVVEDGGTFHIFKVLRNHQSRDMTMEEARGLLEDKLAPYSQEKRRVAWMNELKKDADITIYEKELEKMHSEPEKKE